MLNRHLKCVCFTLLKNTSVLFYSIQSCLIDILFGFMPCFVLCCSDMFHSKNCICQLALFYLVFYILFVLLRSVPFSVIFCSAVNFYYGFCSYVLFWYYVQFHFILIWFVMFCSALDWFALFFSILPISKRNWSDTIWWLPFSSTVLYLEAAAGFNIKFWLLLMA